MTEISIKHEVREFDKRDFGCTQREENPWGEGLESLCKMHFK